MDPLIARRTQYLFETDGYIGTSFVHLPPLFTHTLSPSDHRAFGTAQSCSLRDTPLAECFSQAQIPFQAGNPISSAGRPLSADLFRYSESAATHHWDRTSYERHILLFRQTLEGLLQRSAAPTQNIGYASGDFSPSASEQAMLAQLSQGDIQYLLGMIEFYRNLLPVSSDQAFQAQLRAQGYGAQLASFPDRAPVSLTFQACPAHLSLTLHEVEIEGIPYRIPVYLSPAHEAHWENIRFRLVDYFNRLKVFLTPTQLLFLLSPGGGTPDFSLIFDEREEPSSDRVDRCQIPSFVAGETLPIPNRIIFSQFLQLQTTEYYHFTDFDHHFFHEFGHMVLRRFTRNETRSILEAWRGAIESRFLAQQPYVEASNIFPALSGESLFSDNTRHCFDSFEEWFADLFSEHILSQLSPSTSPLSPHRQARKTIWDELFDTDGFHLERLSLSLILSSYQQVGASEINQALLLRFYPNQSLLARLHSPWHFSSNLILRPSTRRR